MCGPQNLDLAAMYFDQQPLWVSRLLYRARQERETSFETVPKIYFCSFLERRAI